MELFAQRKGHVVRIKMVGEIDHHTARDTRAALDGVLKDKSIMELQLDMKGVTFMDSSGIGMILGRYKVLSARGGKMAIYNPNTHVDKILKMTGVYNVVARKSE
jgi:stage II sporulation protein AA (anti-sigma F factor antagonist)